MRKKVSVCCKPLSFTLSNMEMPIARKLNSDDFFDRDKKEYSVQYTIILPEKYHRRLIVQMLECNHGTWEMGIYFWTTPQPSWVTLGKTFYE